MRLGQQQGAGRGVFNGCPFAALHVGVAFQASVNVASTGTLWYGCWLFGSWVVLDCRDCCETHAFCRVTGPNCVTSVSGAFAVRPGATATLIGFKA